MKKVLIYMLLLANLFSGMAFALDNDPAALLGHEVTTINQMLNTDFEHPDEGLLNGDHCSHGAAHLVGIFYSSSLKETAVGNNHHSIPLASLAFLYISPLLRPPIV
jgi:hypothetical protein